MTVTLHDIVAGLVWLLAAAVLGVVDLIVHARRVRVVASVAQAPAHNGAGGGWLSSTQPSQEPESLERLLGPVGRTSEREG